MVLERAQLDIRPGAEADFESTFAHARTVIAAASGFQGLTLSRCIERPSGYLLLVQWAELTDHTVGFRESPLFQEWRGLVGPFFASPTAVEHYEQVGSAEPPLPEDS